MFAPTASAHKSFWFHRCSLMPPLIILCLSLCLQNLCFILPQFLYQFFCGYSQQVSMSPEGLLSFKDVVNMKGDGGPLNPRLLLVIPSALPLRLPPLPLSLGCLISADMSLRIHSTVPQRSVMFSHHGALCADVIMVTCTVCFLCLSVPCWSRN